MEQHHKDWVDRLPNAIWEYKTTWKNTTGYSPYELVYGKQVLLPIEFQIKTFQTTAEVGMDLSEAQQQRLNHINELDEMRQDDIQQIDLVQQKKARWHDKF